MLFQEIEDIKAFVERVVIEGTIDAVWEGTVLDFLRECYAAKAMKAILENQIKGWEIANKRSQDDIRRQKQVIKDLRGYISYLEIENHRLETRDDED